jgi:dolichyl-phosphate-mannose--protein O-mannosyl transferase
MTREEQLRWRLLGEPIGHRLLGWLGPLVAMAVGGILRFWDLANPHQLVFDETYYVKQGWSMIQWGVELRNDPTLDAAKSIDQNFTGTNQDVYATVGDLVVHPPVGKWLIGWGEQLTGITSSFGWRLAVATFGTLSILILGRVARRLFRSSALGTVAAILLAFEGHHLVHSRTGLLDLFVMFFGLTSFAAVLLDRDASRQRLARIVGAVPPGEVVGRFGRWGPWLGLRPWRWVAGVSLGLCMGTKWSGAMYLVAFGVLSVLWDMSARRAAGFPAYVTAGVIKDGIFAFVAMVGTAVVTYVVSWLGWFRSTQGYDRYWAQDNPATTFSWVPASLRSWWHYQSEMFAVSRSINSPHDYQTTPWSWLIQGRPTSFFYEGPKKGEWGCTVEQCSRAITSIGTPTIWWAGTLMVPVLVFMWALARDWRAGAILAGYAGGYLPWFFLTDRTIYSFYAVAFEVFTVLSVVYGMGLLVGGPDASPLRRRRGLWICGGFVVLTILVCGFFYPIYTAQVIPQDEWRMRMWFPSWI